MSIATACAFALVLVMDSSGSMYDRDFRTQLDATADAIESPAIVRAIERNGGLAVSAVTYADYPETASPWRILRTGADASDFATSLRAIRRTQSGGTRTGIALGLALDLLESAPCGDESVIDLSTDGSGDDLPIVLRARTRAVAAGIRVNAVMVGSASFPTELDRERAVGYGTDWLREYVVTPDGFVATALQWSDYPAVIRRKISMEISALLPSASIP